MSACPHCGKTVEFQKKAPWWRHSNTSANIGIGSVIIISFIAAAFSAQNEISDLSAKIDALTVSVEKIHKPTSQTP